jgi:hypothetical protein
MEVCMAAPNPSSLANIDLGLGGLGDALKRQVADDEEERKKKLLQAGNQSQARSGTANALGLGAINLLGGNG